MLFTVILTSFSGCGHETLDPSVATDSTISPTHSEPLVTNPTATIVVQIPINNPEASPTEIPTVTLTVTPTTAPTVAIEDTYELRGVSNGNSVSGVGTLYKGYVYTEMIDYETAGYGLYCTTMDGDIINRLFLGNVHNINVYQDKAYFVANDDTTDTYRCDLDGSNLEVINKINLYQMIIYDNLIYAITWDEKKLVRFGLDGSNWEELSDDGCYEFIIEQSKIYHSVYYDLFSMNLDGSDKKLLHEIDSIRYLNYSDGWLYFSLNDNIGKMRTDGSELTTIRKGKAFDINVDDEYIYFIDVKKDRELRRMKKDGSEEIILSEPKVYSISIFDDYIRYIYGLDEDHAIYQIKKDGSEKKLIRNDISHRYE